MRDPTGPANPDFPAGSPTRPWIPVILFLTIAAGTTTAIAVLCSAMGWTVESPAWALLVPVAMWAPAIARGVVRRRVDRSFSATLPLGRLQDAGASVVLRPLAIPLAIFSVSYAVAWYAGIAEWNPGGGRWTSRGQIAANLIVNLTILGVFGTFTAMGEEIGWRGYLQPRLDAAGVRTSIVIVSLCQLVYHAPLMVGAGYANTGGLMTSLGLFAIGDLAYTFIIARESYRARTLWPAVFLHSFHNTISQWLFPHFFTVAGDQLWLDGEGGLLPLAGYAALGAAMFLRMRWRGETWQALAHAALTPSFLASRSATAPRPPASASAR